MDIVQTDTAELALAARAAHDRRDWAKAAPLWQALIAHRPEEPLCHSEYAVALREQGDIAGAEQAILVARSRFPEFLGAGIVWADLATRSRDWAEANTRWAAIRAAFPRDAHGYVQGAQALEQMGLLDQADHVLDAGSQTVQQAAWMLSAWGYFAQHHLDTDEALRRWAEVRRRVPDHPVGYTGAAQTLRGKGRHTEAEAMLAGALARFPSDPGPLLEFALTAQEAGDWPEAAQRWAAMRARFPDNLIGYSHGASALRAAGTPAEADAVLGSAVERFPDNQTICVDFAWAGNALVAASDDPANRAEADRRWAIVRARFPAHPIGYVEAARLKQRLGLHEDAEALLEQAAQAVPGDLAIATGWADLATRRQDWAPAAERWREVRHRFPNQPAGVVELAQALQALGRNDEADAALSGDTGNAPTHAPVAIAWAEAAMRRELWGEAVRRWETIRQTFRDEPIAYVQGARALRSAGRDAEADALLFEGGELFPRNAHLRFSWAEAPARSGDWAESVRRWDICRDGLPDETRPWVECATALLNLARVDDAETLLEQAMERFPANLDPMFHWALLAVRHRDNETMLTRWRRVRGTFPQHTPGYVFGAHALQDARRADEAEALIDAAVARFPDQIDVLRAAGEIATRRGDLALASDRFSAAARRFPNDLALARRWVEGLIALQRQDDARAALDDVLRTWPNDPGFLRSRIMLDVRVGQVEGAFALWQRAIAQPDLLAGLGYELAWTMYGEGLPRPLAREALLYLIQEKDTGARDWLPVLAGFLQLRGLKPQLSYLAREILDAEPNAPCDPATMDVVRCALLYEYSDRGLQHFLREYVAKGRVALTAHLFCQNYWKTKKNMFERFTAAFEEYMADRWQDVSWLNADNAAEILAYLNFAAVHSADTYASLIRAMRQCLDLQAMRAQGLHTIAGVVGNIGLEARIDPPPAVPVKRRLRVAICVSGQLRGYQQAVRTWTHLGLQDHDVSVFVHVWKAIGRNWQRIWFFTRSNKMMYDTLVGPSGLAFLRDRYPTLAAAAEAAAAEGNDAREDELKAVYNTDFVRIEDDTRDQFRNRHNLWKMHYKVDQSHKLALEDGRAFDLIIRLRPDREFLPGSAPDWNAIHAESQARRIVYTDSPYLFTERQTWLGDQFAVGTQDVMDVYTGVYSDMEEFTRAGAFPPDVPDHIRPHTNLFYLCFYRGLIGRMMPNVTFGALLDPAMLSIAEVLALARQDIARREEDDFDRQFIAAAEAALAA